MFPQAPGGGFLGVAMLDTRFPRPVGDVGHPRTFDVPVRYRTVPGAAPAEIVTSARALKASPLLPAFVEAMRALEREGAFAITTSCGFLVLLQGELQAAVGVPVVSSSLLALPLLLQRERTVGVLTISEERLTQEYLVAAGVPGDRMGDVVVQGVDADGEFASAILGNREAMDFERARGDVVAAAKRLRARAPDVRTVVLECTNLPPYADGIVRETGWRVVDLRGALGFASLTTSLRNSHGGSL